MQWKTSGCDLGQHDTMLEQGDVRCHLWYNPIDLDISPPQSYDNAVIWHTWKKLSPSISSNAFDL